MSWPGGLSAQPVSSPPPLHARQMSGRPCWTSVAAERPTGDDEKKVMITLNNLRSLRQRLATGWLWWSLAGAVALTDFATKHWVRISLTEGDRIALAESFNLVFFRNAGAAFGLLASADGWQRYFLAAIALGVSALLLWLLGTALAWVEAIAYSLILGGALGNVVDRLNHGNVTDFLDFHWRGQHWPAFNVADIAICIGVLVLIGWTTLTGAGSSDQVKT
ncbi:MAG: signal peptidase II [Rhodoferax sp.]|nr:signal peptidase II [Rhodoferax sp.]